MSRLTRTAPVARPAEVPPLVMALGWSGLLPFILLAAVARVAAPAWAEPARQVLLLYSLAIFCFLCGAWWGIGLMHQRRAPVLLSNLWLLFAVFACAFLPERAALVALAFCLAGLWMLEGRMAVFSRQPIYYRHMRGWLSAVAAAALLLSATRQFA